MGLLKNTAKPIPTFECKFHVDNAWDVGYQKLLPGQLGLCMKPKLILITLSFTLTYNDENLPKKGDYLKTVKSKKISVQTDNSLEVVHLQQFIKKLRKYCAPSKLRYYACGEYGK